MDPPVVKAGLWTGDNSPPANEAQRRRKPTAPVLKPGRTLTPDPLSIGPAVASVGCPGLRADPTPAVAARRRDARGDGRDRREDRAPAEQGVRGGARARLASDPPRRRGPLGVARAQDRAKCRPSARMSRNCARSYAKNRLRQRAGPGPGLPRGASRKGRTAPAPPHGDARTDCTRQPPTGR